MEPDQGAAEAQGGTVDATAPPEGPPVDAATAVAEILAALAYGETRGARRARESVALAPDPRAREAQGHIAEREEQNCDLIRARLAELGRAELMERFRPFFDAFFDHTEPTDWLEAQAFHYMGDAIVSDFAEVLAPLVDRVSGEVVRHTLGDREDAEGFALDELMRALRDHAEADERVRHYARRIIGEAITQTGRALEAGAGIRALLGGKENEKQVVISLLERHRQRLDRLGIEPVEED